MATKFSLLNLGSRSTDQLETMTGNRDSGSLSQADEVPSDQGLEADAPIKQQQVGSDPRPEPIVTGLQDIVTNTDISFGYRLSELEKLAMFQAGAHAQAGLPRLQVIAEEEVAIESVLRVRACEVFLDWAFRVRRKVQDAIQFTCNQAGNGIVSLRYLLDELEAAAGQMLDVRRRIRSIEEETQEDRQTFEYRAMLTWPFWLLVALVTAVDWVANLPVFRLLLPLEAGTDARLADFAASAEHFGPKSGIVNLFHRVIYSPEISLFAFGVVVFLMFMADVLGKSTRQIVAFWPRTEGQKVVGLETHRRQAFVPAIASAVAVFLVIIFLFLARASAVGSAQERRDQAHAKVVHLTEVAAQPVDAQTADNSDSTSALTDAQSLEATANEALDYAKNIEKLNWPILLLNLVLALVAASAAYLHDQRDISDTKLSDPRLTPLEAEFKTLAASADSTRQRFRATDTAIQTALAQSRYLSQSFPLRDSSSKSERLNGVIPSFRAENARLRGIDTQNVLAFKEDCVLRLPDIRADDPMSMPPELSVYEREFAELRAKIEKVDALVSRAKMGVEVSA